MRSWLLLPLALTALTGCNAAFDDLRPAASLANTPGNTPVTNPTPGTGTSTTTDPVEPNPTGQDTVVASGAWDGRADYSASGTAELVQLANGSFEVRFSGDFSVSRVPGPVVVLTRREDIGRAISPEQGDIELGVQSRPGGAQSYAVPVGADDRRFVWIYCKPFGLEVGRAELIRR